MLIIHISGARDIFLLFCEHQDTEYEWKEMDILIAVQILNQEKIKASMRKIYLYSTIWEGNTEVILHIYGARAVFLLFCVHQYTHSEQQEFGK